MASWKKLDKELQHQLCGMARFGQSKHEAKQAAKEAYLKEHGDLKGWNPCKVEGIYGIQTMETYRAAMTDFAKYAAAKGVHHVKDISRNDAIQYLRDRQAEGKSAWTTTRDMSAINKVFGYDLTKKEVGLRERRDEDVKRSREVCAHDKYVDTEKYKDQMDFARACGCRRQSVDEVRYGDLQWKDGRVVAVKLTEKGGKERTAPILNEYKDRIKSKEVSRNMRCIYIMGGSGTGKTTYAKEYAKKLGYSTFISSGSNDPMDSYAGQDCIILDDLRPSCMGLSDLLKMLDNNTSSTVKSRYFNKVLECRLIIITTTLDITDFFKNVFSEEPETSVQLKRRCELMVKFHKEGANDKLEIYQYNLKTDTYDLLGYQENPLPKFIKEDKERKERAIKAMSVLGELTPPPPPPPPEPEMTEEERIKLGLPF